MKFMFEQEQIEAFMIGSVAAIIITMFGLYSCRHTEDTSMNVTTPEQTSSSRISVTRIGVINDSLAYNERRGIYIIMDTKTGKEYVGVSGIGISDLGSHSTGKASITDER